MYDLSRTNAVQGRSSKWVTRERQRKIKLRSLVGAEGRGKQLW